MLYFTIYPQLKFEMAMIDIFIGIKSIFLMNF